MCVIVLCARAAQGCSRGCQFGVVEVACGVALGLLFKALLHGLGEVYTGLVGQADEYPQHVGHLFRRVVCLAFFERLVAILSGHHTGQFAHLLSEAGHVGEFAEIAYAIGVYPFVYTPL